jgi:hypothetical protein
MAARSYPSIGGCNRPYTLYAKGDSLELGTEFGALVGALRTYSLPVSAPRHDLPASWFPLTKRPTLGALDCEGHRLTRH